MNFLLVIFWKPKPMKNFIRLFSIICPLIIISTCKKDKVSTEVTNTGEATISTDGGYVYSKDGMIKLSISPNTISSPTLISIKPSMYGLPNFINSNDFAGGRVYDLEPSGMIFSNPVTVEISYAEFSNLSNPENLGILQIGNDEDKFIDIISVTNNTLAKTLTFTIDNFSQMQIIEFQNKWAIFKFYWSIPLIKWYLEAPASESYLNESNIQTALDLWAVETRSFVFEKTNDINTANLIFKEVSNLNGLESYENKFHVHYKTAGMTCLDFWSDFSGKVVLKEGNQINILLASDLFNDPNEDINLTLAKTTIAHEIGHALGIAHSVQQVSPIALMNNNTNSSEVWSGSLNQWDKNALHENYIIKQNPSTGMKIETLVDNLEYPSALFLRNNKLFYTEAAAMNTQFGGRTTINYYDLQTSQVTLLTDRPMNFNSMVVIGENIYLSLWGGQIPGDFGRMSIFNITGREETPFMNLAIAPVDMSLDSENNIYLLGTSDTQTAKSLYKFPVGNYKSPVILLEGLGRTTSILSENGDLFYSDGSTIWKMTNSSKTEVYKETRNGNYISSFVFTDKYLYYSDVLNSRIYQVNKQTLDLGILFDTIPYPDKMILDSENKLLYVISHGTEANNFKDGKVFRITNIE